jgi:hypothetical protein
MDLLGTFPSFGGNRREENLFEDEEDYEDIHGVGAPYSKKGRQQRGNDGKFLSDNNRGEFGRSSMQLSRNVSTGGQ